MTDWIKIATLRPGASADEVKTYLDTVKAWEQVHATVTRKRILKEATDAFRAHDIVERFVNPARDHLSEFRKEVDDFVEANTFATKSQVFSPAEYKYRIEKNPCRELPEAKMLPRASEAELKVAQEFDALITAIKQSWLLTAEVKEREVKKIEFEKQVALSKERTKAKLALVNATDRLEAHRRAYTAACKFARDRLAKLRKTEEEVRQLGGSTTKTPVIPT